MLRWLTPVLVLASLLLACADEDLATPAPTEASTSSTAETPTSTATAATPIPTYEAFRAGLWLIDVETGDVHVLYESDTGYPILPLDGGWRGGSEIWVYFVDGDHSVRYALDGSQLEDVPGYQLQLSDCEVMDQEALRVRIGDREFRDVPCGVVAPDGRHMLYGHNIDGPEVPGGRYDAWILDITAGEQWPATDQLRHCGGCDSRAGPSWSPSGAFVTLGETYAGVDSTIYLVDVLSRRAEPLLDGQQANSSGNEPRWAPDRDLLLMPTQDGEAAILDAPTGVAQVLAGSTWPAWWSAGGAFVYWIDGGSTAVADAKSGIRVATWPGRPSTAFWQGRVSITDATGLDSEIAPAALLGSEGGMWIYDPAIDGGLFIEGGAGGTWSPDASRAAFAIREPTSEFDVQRWFIAVYSDHGRWQTVADDARSAFGPPEVWWNDAGTHLLVRWPGSDWP